MDVYKNSAFSAQWNWQSSITAIYFLMHPEILGSIIHMNIVCICAQAKLFHLSSKKIHS